MRFRGAAGAALLTVFAFVGSYLENAAQGQAKNGQRKPTALKKKPVLTTMEDAEYETFRKAHPADAYFGTLFPLLTAGKTETRLLRLTGANASSLPLAVRVTPTVYKLGEKPKALPAFEQVLPHSLTSQQNYALRLSVPNFDVNATVEYTLLLHRKSEPLVSLRETFVAVAEGKAGTQIAWLGRDDKTQGNWLGVYGAEAFLVATAGGRSVYQSPFITLNRGLGSVGADMNGHVLDSRNSEESASKFYSRADSLPDKRLPQYGPGQAERRPPVAFSAQRTPLIFRAEAADGRPHTFSLYVLDFRRAGQIMQADVYDFQRHRLHTQKIENFGEGAYLRYRFSGKIAIVLTSFTPGLPPVAQALFVDP